MDHIRIEIELGLMSPPPMGSIDELPFGPSPLNAGGVPKKLLSIELTHFGIKYIPWPLSREPVVSLLTK